MNLRIQRWLRLSSTSSKCFVYTPEAMNSAPSFIIAARTRSPSRSTNVTLLTSTTHLRFPLVQWDLSQFALRRPTHGPESRPCNVHLCTVDSSRIVVLNTVLSIRTLEVHAPCQSRIQKRNRGKARQIVS